MKDAVGDVILDLDQVEEGGIFVDEAIVEVKCGGIDWEGSIIGNCEFVGDGRIRKEREDEENGKEKG